MFSCLQLALAATQQREVASGTRCLPLGAFRALPLLEGPCLVDAPGGKTFLVFLLWLQFQSWSEDQLSWLTVRHDSPTWHLPKGSGKGDLHGTKSPSEEVDCRA